MAGPVIYNKAQSELKNKRLSSIRLTQMLNL